MRQEPEVQRTKDKTLVEEKIDGAWIWTDGSVKPAVAAQYFLQPPERLRGERIGQGGRGQAFKIDLHGQPVVLRFYQRGGAMAWLNRDRYFSLTARTSRARDEFDIMTTLADRGLPVPRPVAAMANRVIGFAFRLAIMTPFIENQGTLADCDSHDAWYNAGFAIGQLHRMGVWHADLNVYNVLIDKESKAWLLDFDRARQGVQLHYRLLANLVRLRRSVVKVCPQRIEHHWPILLKGYDAA